MERKKKIFIISGLIILIILLALKFGLLDKLKNELKTSIELTADEVTPKFEKKVVEKTQEQAVEGVVKIVDAPKAEKTTISPIKEDVISTIIPTSDETPTPQKEQISQVQSQEIPTDYNSLGSGNPFNYSSNSAEDYSPLTSNKAVGLISIKGIICLEGEDPRAIIHINDTNTTYYVKKGDVIRINTPSKSATLITESYISVKDIRNDEVELVQQERPDRVIIVR